MNSKPRHLDSETLEAGDFDTWLSEISRALRGQGSSNVPCGECTACCTSSQFVYIGAHEKQTLARIPPALVFAAPGRSGFVLGYNEKGHCPMLSAGKCTIYEDRPQTCRVYDCRIFTAAGIRPEKQEKPDIYFQTERWRFDFSSEAGRRRRKAIETAAEFLKENPLLFENGAAPPATQLAVLALRLHHVFMAQSENADAVLAKPGMERVRKEMERLKAE